MPTEQCCRQYLTNIPLPDVKQEHRDSLDKDINIREIEETISNMKLGKFPGPDGLSYTGEYFVKTYAKFIN